MHQHNIDKQMVLFCLCITSITLTMSHSHVTSLLDSDDDELLATAVIEDRDIALLPNGNLTASSESSESSSSTSLSRVSSDSPRSASHLTITATSVHRFLSYDALKAFMREHAAAHGFEVRLAAGGGVRSGNHNGSFECWCRDPPPVASTDEVIQSVPALRTVYIKTSSRGGKQVKCGCTWFVNFFRRKEGDYLLTDSRSLTHTGHTPLSPSELVDHVDSLRNVSPEIEKEVRSMITSGMHGIESERRHLQQMHNVTIDRDTFHNLVKKVKGQLGIVDSTVSWGWWRS
jgi:hypothetical protein